VLFAYIASDERDYALQPHQVAEVRLSLPKTPSGGVAAVDESQHNCG